MNEIGLYFKKINNRMVAERNLALKALGITSTQLDFLEYLYHCPEQYSTLSDLSAYFDVKHTSALHVIRILEQNNLIIREPVTSGSRCRRLCLTNAALSLVQEYEASIVSKEEQLTCGLTEADKHTLRQLLSRIYQNLEK
jgi:MarR family transcriptional regulator for hemolysin